MFINASTVVFRKFIFNDYEANECLSTFFFEVFLLSGNNDEIILYSLVGFTTLSLSIYLSLYIYLFNEEKLLYILSLSKWKSFYWIPNEYFSMLLQLP